MRSRLLALAICFLVGYSVIMTAQTKPIPDEIKLKQLQEERQGVERAQAALAALEKSAELIAATYKYECLAAVGHGPLCTCLSNNTPIRVTFSSYVAIVTKNRSSVEYNGLSVDDKRMVDATFEARDKCVAIAFPNR